VSNLSAKDAAAPGPLPPALGGDVPVIRLRRPGRWIAAAIIAVLLAGLIVSMITNPRFRWDIVGTYLFHPAILAGLVATIWLTIAAMTIGIVLGTVIALMRISSNPVLQWVASGYQWLFRGTPLLVQLIFWYNLSALYPRITIGIPFVFDAFSFDSNTYITVYVAALLGLGLIEAAFMSEIVRSGLTAVPQGQREAASALGLPSSRVMLRIILPQAMRVIIPPTGNQLISMLKTTSLVSVIAMQDLLYAAQLIYTSNFQTIPLLIVTCFWYLTLTSILTIGQHYLEAYFGRSDRRVRYTATASTGAVAQPGTGEI
jgi:polar amino acid transport system permease protein